MASSTGPRRLHRRRRVPGSTVLHYCQHSTGLGHLVRSLAVAGALARDHRVVLASGGAVPAGLALPAGVELVELPPVSGTPGALSGGAGAATLAEVLLARTGRLLSLFDEVDPDVLLVELFPFGRRAFARELLPLLERARRGPRRPLVLSSVRDLLVTGHPDQQRHDDEAAARLEAYFDAVLVHADPRLARLEETFRPAVWPAVPVHYTGLVSTRTGRPRPTRRHRNQVVVSAGGGLVGGRLLTAAAEAQAGWLSDHGLRTRLVTGPFLPAAEAARLRELAAEVPGLSVDAFLPDLAATIAASAVSVSQAGYNTTLDLLRAGVPALVVPYADGRETEQTERARRLQRLGLVDVLPADQLGAQTLAQRVLRLHSSAPPALAVDLDGAGHTARLVAELLGRTGAVAG